MHSTRIAARIAGATGAAIVVAVLLISCSLAGGESSSGEPLTAPTAPTTEPSPGSSVTEPAGDTEPVEVAEPTESAEPSEPATVSPPVGAASDESPAESVAASPVPSPQVMELPTGGPTPAAGESYDLAIVCDPAMRMWIDDGHAVDDTTVSWRALHCDGVAAFIEFGVPAADARVFALVEEGQRLPQVQRRLHRGTFSAEQDAALVAAAGDGALIDATVWCGTTVGTIAIGTRTETCVPNEAAYFADVPLGEALTQLTGPPGYDVWVLLMRH